MAIFQLLDIPSGVFVLDIPRGVDFSLATTDGREFLLVCWRVQSASKDEI